MRSPDRVFASSFWRRAERLEEAGAGLQFSPNASRVLIDLGLQPRLARARRHPDAISIMSASGGGEIARLPLGEAATFRAGAPYWVVHRADLQGALQAQVNDHPDIELRLGCQFEDVVPHAKGLTVVQRSGMARQQELAVALIGADGIWSTVRHHLFPEVQPQFSGLIAWRGTLDATQLPREYTSRRVQLWMGPNAHLVAYPISGARQINVVAVVPGTWNRPGWSAPGESGEIKNAFASSLAGTGADDARRRRRVAQMGAVHGARRRPLDRGRDRAAGGCRARHAAVCRARRRHGDRGCRGAGQVPRRIPKRSAAGISAALQRYARARRSRVTRVQRAARQQGRIYHLRGPAAFARDLVIKAMGAQAHAGAAGLDL